MDVLLMLLVIFAPVLLALAIAWPGIMRDWRQWREEREKWLAEYATEPWQIELGAVCDRLIRALGKREWMLADGEVVEAAKREIEAKYGIPSQHYEYHWTAGLLDQHTWFFPSDDEIAARRDLLSQPAGQQASAVVIANDENPGVWLRPVPAKLYPVLFVAGGAGPFLCHLKPAVFTVIFSVGWFAYIYGVLWMMCQSGVLDDPAATPHEDPPSDT